MSSTRIGAMSHRKGLLQQGTVVAMLDDRALVASLQAGDEATFKALVAKHDGALRRVARTSVRTSAPADDVVQETWLAVIQGPDRFEGRSSLRDLVGLKSEDVCSLLEISDGNQRVLLHRARARVRAALGGLVEVSG
jgi:DNA-directed RNA polymerase specialized sigma24 family protein